MGQFTRGSRTQESAPAEPAATRLNAVLSSMRDLVFVRDADGLLTYCSPSVFDTLGYRTEELDHTPERNLVHPSDVDARDALVWASETRGALLPPIELRLRDQSGAWHWFESIETNCLDDPDIRGIVTISRDITDHKARHAELIERTRSDPLTAIPNRLALMERLEMALSRAARTHEVVAVMFFDIDDFKLINDGYGHDFADHVLVEVARRLERLQRKSDTVARIGGDEFAVVCDGLHDAEESTAIASRIQCAIAKPIVVDGRECLITASIGIATFDGASGEFVDPAALLRNADAAMYRAKSQGHARWHRFDDALVREAARRFELEADLAPALEHGEFVLRYEPIHELRSRSIVGVEAFVRWEHPTRGSLEESEFIEIAEQTGMIVPIGAWAVRAACMQARSWCDAGWPGWLSVHLSGREVAEPGLAGSVATVLTDTGVAPERLWLELPESVFSRAGRATTTELTTLQSLGVHIGVADFGTAHTPLPKLQQLPTDFVKIDGGFVSNLTFDGAIHPAGHGMVSALVQVGTALGLSVIAEGIQSEIETELLLECGCQYGQGELLTPCAPPGARSSHRS